VSDNSIPRKLKVFLTGICRNVDKVFQDQAEKYKNEYISRTDGAVEADSINSLDQIATLNIPITAASSSHTNTQLDSASSCLDCNQTFTNKVALNIHSKQTQHSPYHCTCKMKFSRLDTLQRHIHTFQPITTYKCPYCSNYDEDNEFTRKDHLRQHIVGFHRIQSVKSDTTSVFKRPKKRRAFSCTHEDCIYGSGQPGYILQSQAELTKHLRQSHNESRFSCGEPGCGKVGGQGFSRMRDLSNHRKVHHMIYTQPMKG
jgi:hypothetical protein